jgi:nitrogen-specific signal transduction histidine kinase
LNIYRRKERWKFFLFIVAAVIGISSLMYTNKLVQELSVEERKKVEIWAEATRRIGMATTSNDELPFLLKIIQANTTIPVIVTNSDQQIMLYNNLDSLRAANDSAYLYKQLAKMQESFDPIRINLPGGDYQLIYYDKSTLLTRLTYYPYVQLAVIMLFIVVAYLAFSSSRKAEQNQVWVGLSKETAHQLGTPISSLMAWHEMLKLKNVDEDLQKEFDKDLTRLEKIAERFSKIGSKPKLKQENVIQVLQNSLNYIKSRSSDRIKVSFHPPEDKIYLPLNAELFEWVIENICKNGIDAMNGSGQIQVSLQDNTQVLYVDIADSGKGIPKNKFKTIFKPGYTTKDRGWGLGLSLTKRIVEEYHDGKVFVHFSEVGKGTKIRIVLKKYL